MKHLIYFTTTLILFSSCYQYKEVSIIGTENFKIKKIDKKNIQFEISIKLKNPNSFGFYVYSGKANIYFTNLLIGTASLQKKVYIPSHSTGTYTMNILTSLDKVTLKDIIANLNFSNFGKIKIDGHVKVGKFILRKKIKTKYEDNIIPDFQFNFLNSQ